jgi:arylsulfatase A-like enzyme
VTASPARTLALVLLLSALVGGLSCAAGERRPNVVLINIDDLGWRDVGCFGSTRHATPNIDALCSQGVKFTNAYSAAAVCSPARAALLTGRHPSRNGVTDWIRPPGGRPKARVVRDGIEYQDEPERLLLVPPPPRALPLEEITLAETLSEAGYATAHIGKWHLGGRNALPVDQGFDSNRGGHAQGQPPSYFDPYSRKGRAGLPGLPPRKEGEHLTDREADEAVRFIRENRGHPFFLNLWHHAVHPPIQGRADLVAKYAHLGERHAAYAAMVEGVDESVGALLRVLDELGLSENTLVILTSDNGGWTRVSENAPLRGGKGGPYEGGLRIPQIIRFPGRVPPGVSHDPVTGVDLLPTILEATGTRSSGSEIDGTSLLPLLVRATSSLPRPAIYWHYPHYWQNEVPYSVIRKGRYKLIRRYEGVRFELYDLEEDLGEQNDLTAAMPELVGELDADLDAWLRETGAIIPIPRS